MEEIQPTRNVRGITVPSVLYGTAWKKELTHEGASNALRLGFRGLDTANQPKHYEEAAVGGALAAAIAAGALTREAVFVQTKFTPGCSQDHRPPYDIGADTRTQVMQSISSSLEHLQVDYLDSCLLHCPRTADGLCSADWEAWHALEEASTAGSVKLIGVSNFSASQIGALLQGAAVAPAFLQNRCQAISGWDIYVRDLCRSNGIAYQGFSLIGSNRVQIEEPAIVELARRHGKSVQQVVFRFALQCGILPVTSPRETAHMRENLDLFDFTLSQDELEAVFLVGLRL